MLVQHYRNIRPEYIEAGKLEGNDPCDAFFLWDTGGRIQCSNDVARPHKKCVLTVGTHAYYM